MPPYGEPIDPPYEFGHPESYLLPHQIAKCTLRKNMADYIRAAQSPLPRILQPMAEDMPQPVTPSIRPHFPRRVSTRPSVSVTEETIFGD